MDDGAVVLAGAHAIFAARLQHIPAETADGLARRDGQQPCGSVVHIGDAALLIDGVHAFDDAAEHRLRFGFALPERVGEIDEVAAHVIHGARQLPDLRRAAGGNRGGEVALAEINTD